MNGRHASSSFQEYFSLEAAEKDDNDENSLELYTSTNRLIEREIEVLKCHVLEAEKDIITLTANETNLQPDFSSDDSNDGNMSENKIQTKLSGIEYEPSKSEEIRLNLQIKDLLKDISDTKKEMERLKDEEEYYKNQVECSNQVFLHVLGLDFDYKKHVNNYNLGLDLERLFADSYKLSQDLQKENEISPKNMKHKWTVRASKRQKFLSVADAYSYGWFSIEQIERILRMLKREKKYLDETNLHLMSKVLEKLAVVLLHKLADKKTDNIFQENTNYHPEKFLEQQNNIQTNGNSKDITQNDQK